jgi:amino-acid N-acetyltransferase
MNPEKKARSYKIRNAHVGDYEIIRSLVHEANLPTKDLLDDVLKHFIVCVCDEAIVGVVGLEQYGMVALIRSLAVAKSHRSHGIATRLLSEMETLALALVIGPLTLFALTTTARQWLERHGFNELDRGQVPEAIRESSQFRDLCPASATCLAKTIA